MEKIIEGNKLIAEFMGMKRHDHASYATWEQKDGTHIFESVLQYDTKWGWLMPVAEKIEWMDSDKIDSRVTIERQSCRIYFNNYEGEKYEWAFGGVPKIESTWKSIVRFITWYNQTKNQ
jgi:hypothetical protein